MLFGEGPFGEGPFGEDYVEESPAVISSSAVSAQSWNAAGGFKIETSGGRGQMTFMPSTDIVNNIYLSLIIKKGSWFFDREFGMRDIGRMKNTEQNAALIREYAKEALQWILSAGRATVINISSEIVRLHMLKLLIEAVQADGRVVTFTIFKEVI